MNKFLLTAAAFFAANVMVNAQGKFETVELKNSTLHVYYTNDALANASYIVEGKDALVVLEAPLFKSSLAEFDTYIVKIGKPIASAVIDYHLGGQESRAIVMPQGMHKFTNEGVYASMMSGFRRSFGDTMVDSFAEGEVREVPFGQTVQLAGVDFRFDRGPANDFPGAMILIDGTACLMHWAPAKTHMNTLQISSQSAVAQALEGLVSASESGANIWLGSHGGVADREALEFRINYLLKIQELLAGKPDAKSLSAQLKAAYPGLAGEEGVDALAEALCK